ncbi:MAG: Hsp70 family protein [Planctomycetota bacterium]
MSGRTVGIDLGTTNSEVAAHTDRGVVVLEEDGNAIVPSCVGLSPDGRVLVGEEALHQEILHPDRTVRSVKRLLGTEERISLGGQTFRPQEIAALILGALKDRAERVLGETVSAAVITVPAYFSDAQRQATREAGEIAGLRVARILNEPTSAALAFPTEGTPARTAMVYDLGGGTFDVSIVRLDHDVTEVLASHGDVHLGGDDFDRILLEHVLEGPDGRAAREAVARDPHARARLLRAAEAARRELSQAPHAAIREDSVWMEADVPRHVDLPIERGEFETWIAPLLEKTVESVHQALADAALDHRGLDTVLLAGGATRTPAVRRLLEDLTGQPPSTVLHPDTCVALGAGLVAARVEGRSDSSVLVDVTPYTFGPRHVRLGDDEPSFFAYAPLIRRNTPLPTTRTESFATMVDGQRTVEVEIFQGEDPDTRNNLRIGEFEISGLADVPAGNEILLRMRLDVDGILDATAVERATGRSRSVSIRGAVGRLGARDVARARERMTRLRRDTVAEAEHAEKGAVPAPGSGDARLPPPVRHLLERSRRAMASLAREDRGEAEALIASLRANDGEEREEIQRSLEDLLFYAGEGGA